MRYTFNGNMAKLSRDSKENIVYLILWFVLALTPVVAMAIKTLNHAEQAFDWLEVAHAWLVYAVFLVPFLLHNYLIAPLLLYKHHCRAYFLATIALLVVFFVAQRWERPAVPEAIPNHPVEHVDAVVGQDGSGSYQIHRPHRPRPVGNEDGHIRPPFFFEQLDVIKTIVLMLILGMNLGVKLYFKQERDRKQLALLEQKNLEQQLEYLKFQVNPHFFMNTLNNIHALVDIDPEKAKESIVELSRMMRYLLYDGNSRFIPLEKEISFIRHYVRLMRMRYSDHVRLSVSVPEHVPEVQIPPLVLFTFIENAFKHGITYKRECFIELTIEVENDKTIHLRCRNSRADKSSDMKGGVGLTNLCQRLDLIYGDNWECTVDDNAKTYTSDLRIPLSPSLPKTVSENQLT